MYENMRKLSFIVISRDWSQDESQRYQLIHRETALDFLKGSASINFDDSLWLWAFYFLITEFDFVAFDVIKGRRSGKNIEWLEGRVAEYITIVSDSKK